MPSSATQWWLAFWFLLVEFSDQLFLPTEQVGPVHPAEHLHTLYPTHSPCSQPDGHNAGKEIIFHLATGTRGVLGFRKTLARRIFLFGIGPPSQGTVSALKPSSEREIHWVFRETCDDDDNNDNGNGMVTQISRLASQATFGGTRNLIKLKQKA